MKRFFLILVVFVYSSIIMYSQNEVDALRYTYICPFGTARTNAMSGSFGAAGADHSNIFFNPAGLGIYRTSDISTSMGLNFTNTKTDFLNKQNTDFNTNFNLSNISCVGSINNVQKEDNPIRKINLAFSYNKLNNFNESILIEGNNKYNSFTDWLAIKANNNKPNQLNGFYSKLAWNGYLIDPANSDTTLYKSVYKNKYGIQQKQLIDRSGSQGIYNFSIATNLLDKLFLGMSLGVESVNYEENKVLEEKDINDSIPDFKSFKFREYLGTRGSGVNFNIGIIYAPTNWVRFGASLHTPTFFKLTDNYNSYLSTVFEDTRKTSDLNSANGSFNYELVTPIRVNASIAFIILKNAIINIDYENLNYNQSRLRSKDYDFGDENNNIRMSYKQAHNIKLGLEYKLGILAFRVGAAYFDSPYKSNHTNNKAYTIMTSAGLGMRFTNCYFDISYSLISNKQKYFMYDSQEISSPVTNILTNKNRLFFTFGFKI